MIKSSSCIVKNARSRGGWSVQIVAELAIPIQTLRAWMGRMRDDKNQSDRRPAVEALFRPTLKTCAARPHKPRDILRGRSCCNDAQRDRENARHWAFCVSNPRSGLGRRRAEVQIVTGN